MIKDKAIKDYLELVGDETIRQFCGALDPDSEHFMSSPIWDYREGGPVPYWFSDELTDAVYKRYQELKELDNEALNNDN